uniref:Uncharacterized protein n=1 Tax=Musa acuminata subsp. malaccensis TaxID=214687 RepID=A0A804IH83_MUSAM
MDDENLVFETSPGVEAITSFDEMGILDDLLRGIYAYGFEKPSPRDPATGRDSHH